MFTRTAALTQVLICVRRPRMKSVSSRGTCGAAGYRRSRRLLSGPGTVSSSNFLDASVILRCCWMMRRSAGSSHSSQ